MQCVVAVAQHVLLVYVQHHQNAAATKLQTSRQMRCQSTLQPLM
jgi:hypothetical protein